jgi:hypothetical protein
LAFFVDEQGKGDSGVRAKLLCVMPVAETDGSQRGAAILEFLFVGAQLRDVLAAENSTVMPQKNNHRGLSQPERSQADFPAVGVG